MIEHILTLIGASGSGAILGLLGNLIGSRLENKRLDIQKDIEIAKANAQALSKNTESYREPNIDEGQEVEVNYLWGLYKFKGKTRPRVMRTPFSGLLYILGGAYAASATYSILVGDVPVATINPTTEPIVESWGWGFWERTYTPTIVAVQTFASVGQYMFHFIAFILSAVITGVDPKRS